MSETKAKAGKLIFDRVTPGVEYHAAFVSGRARPYTPLHTHDFYEVFYLLEGTATHIINERTTALAAGDLVLIRPEDCHAISGKTFHLINVAFPSDPWNRYCALAGLEETGLVKAVMTPPPTLRVPSELRQECAAIFGRILHAFQQAPQGRPARQELCRFWSAMLEFLLPTEPETADPDERGMALPCLPRDARRGEPARGAGAFRRGQRRQPGAPDAHAESLLRADPDRVPE
jgi:quercetin dioxygenase-like cupin family protein